MKPLLKQCALVLVGIVAVPCLAVCMVVMYVAGWIDGERGNDRTRSSGSI